MIWKYCLMYLDLHHCCVYTVLDWRVRYVEYVVENIVVESFITDMKNTLVFVQANGDSNIR